MSKMVHKVSHTVHDNANKSHAVKQSIRTTTTNFDNETIINSITGSDNKLSSQLEQLEREAEMQARQIELSECLEFVAQLVDLFKHTVVTSELQKQNDWHNDTRHHLQKNKNITTNRLLDNKIEKIVIDKGLTKEQWNCLLYIALSTGDTVEITKVSKKHLQKVHDKTLRLLDDDEKNAVFALINAIELHMSQNHFIEK